MSPRRATTPGRAAVALALAVVGAGCGPRKAAEGGPESRLRADDVVVATVNGSPITAARVAEHGRAIGAAPRAALDDLIGFELLAGEAARRGFGAAPEIAEARTREAERRFLQVEFEAHHRLEDIPEADVRREYERNIHHFEHPELRTVVTVLFPALRGASSRADDARAKGAAQDLATRWRAERPDSAKTARAILDTYFRDLGGVNFSQFNTWSGSDAEPEWLKATMALRERGEVSPPVRTRYGWHVVLLLELHPAMHTPMAEALATVRREMFPLWQRAAFSRFVDEVTARHSVNAFPERIPTAASAFPAPPLEPGAEPR